MERSEAGLARTGIRLLLHLLPRACTMRAVALALLPALALARGGGGGPPPPPPPGSCDATGLDAAYEESITGGSVPMRRIVSSGCPNHPQVRLNPHNGRPQDIDQQVPAVPMIDEGAAVRLNLRGGTVGVTINGGLIFSAYAGAGHTPPPDGATRERNAVGIEGRTFDYCGGHSNSGGNYHYHSVPPCLLDQIAGGAAPPTEPSPQLGWMYDGLPVFGPLGPGGTQMIRCVEEGADPRYCLDECNGFAGALDSDDFLYRYYFTGPVTDLVSLPADPLPGPEYFPHAPNCFMGCCPAGATGCFTHVPACTASAVPATASGFTPEPLRGITEPWQPASAEAHLGGDWELAPPLESLPASAADGSAVWDEQAEIWIAQEEAGAAGIFAPAPPALSDSSR